MICNYYFIRLYQARGAVIGTIAAELVGFIIQTAVAAKDIAIWKLMKEGLIFALPGALMGGIVILFFNLTGSGVVQLCFGIAIGIITYVLMGVLTMRIFDRDRLHYFRQRYFVFAKRR